MHRFSGSIAREPAHPEPFGRFTPVRYIPSQPIGYRTMTSSLHESPLDPYLATFLAAIANRAGGFTPGQESRALAEDLELQHPFVDMLFTSARMRGLLKPAYGRGSKVVWQVSDAGQELIGRLAPPAVGQDSSRD